MPSAFKRHIKSRSTSSNSTSRRTKQTGEFTYTQPDDQHIVLRGKLDNNPVVVQFHRYKTTQFLLTSRGFHWINEDPFNR